MTYVHHTVLKAETALAVLEGVRHWHARHGGGGWLVDCTLGGGGHAEALLEATAPMPSVRLLGIDRDPAALAAASARLARFGQRFVAVHGRFGQLASLCAAGEIGAGTQPLLGIVADLGVSSPQFDDAARGFSFRLDGPLDMRMDPTHGPTAAELLGQVRVEDLADVLYQFGDIRRSIGTARIVLEEFHRGAHTTAQLADRLTARLPRTRSLHPATQVFQALRMWVNAELTDLQQLLDDAPALLAPNAALAIISFHSGEDRPVKQRFAELAKTDAFRIPVRRGVVPSELECRENPRARSARLRVLLHCDPLAEGDASEGDAYGDFDADDEEELSSPMNSL